jgi:hypothetical protein
MKRGELERRKLKNGLWYIRVPLVDLIERQKQWDRRERDEQKKRKKEPVAIHGAKDI